MLGHCLGKREAVTPLSHVFFLQRSETSVTETRVGITVRAACWATVEPTCVTASSSPPAAIVRRVGVDLTSCWGKYGRFIVKGPVINYGEGGGLQTG